MDEQNLDQSQASMDPLPTERDTSHLDKRFGTIGWALFFIWIGISILVNLSIGIGLLGIGLITLGVQIARKNTGLKIEGFWFVVGLLFLIGGLWELFEPDLPLVPVLLIVAGVVLVLSVSFGKKK